MRAAVVLALALAACNTTPPAGPAPAKPTPPVAPRASASAPATSASARAELPPLPPEGCWSGAEPPAAARAKLEALSAACIQGMQRVGDVAPGTELPFTISDASRCVRAAAAGGPGVEQLTLAVVDAEGHALGATDLRAPFAFVGERGPICVASPGKYRAVARVTRGAGDVAIAVWQANGSAPDQRP